MTPYRALDHFWVTPAFMAKGSGQALLKHAVQQAKNCAMSSIYIDADLNAEAFYLYCDSLRVGELIGA